MSKGKDIIFYTDTIDWVVILTQLIGNDLSSKWHIEANIDSENSYLVTIKNNVLRPFWKRKQVAEERSSILNLIKVAENHVKYVNGENKKNHGKPDIPVLYTISEPPFESWIGNKAIRALLCKKPDLLVPVLVLAVLAPICKEDRQDNIIYRKSIDLSIIDENIRSLVVALNNLSSIWTTYSCQGHFLREPRSPFVRFITSNSRDVFTLHKVISSCKTRFKWLIKAAFLSYHRIQWEITTNKKRDPLTGNNLNEDILLLSSALTSSSLLSEDGLTKEQVFGDENKIEVLL